MARVKYTNAGIDLMARMMRAEAVGEGKLGMLFVGNVIVNRAVADCLDFTDVRTIQDVIFQVQGGNYSFEAVQKGSLFYKRARSVEKRLAKKNLQFWRTHPAKYALWYLTLMPLALKVGMVNPLPAVIKVIVFMNHRLERAQVFINRNFA